MKRVREVLVVGAVVVLIVILTGAVLMFPTSRFRPTSESPVVKAVEQAPDLDAYLRSRESEVAKLRPGLNKGIVWAGAKGVKTKIAFVYLHGFTASRGEIAPVMDDVASDLHANLYYTRLKAHGLADGEDFANVTAQDWLDDAREALAIGRRIGERVVLVGMSTGALLALELANENPSVAGKPSDIHSMVLLSPNYRPASALSHLVTGPAGRFIASKLIGEYHSFRPDNEAHAILWTPRTRVQGVFALMELVDHVARMDLSKITVPTLTIYTSKDTVVHVPLIAKRHAEIGASIKRIIDLPQATRHEIASRALAPDVVAPTVAVIEDFVRGIP